MTEKPPVWADWLLTVWVLVVGVFYFGGCFLPSQIGRYTVAASALYALMLLVAAGTLAFQFLRPGEAKPAGEQEEVKTPQKSSAKKRK